jgi:hypothetical protein
MSRAATSGIQASCLVVVGAGPRLAPPARVFNVRLRRLNGAPDERWPAVSDVLQVWVDAAAHPSRGRERAELIRRRVLRRLIEEGR